MQTTKWMWDCAWLGCPPPPDGPPRYSRSYTVHERALYFKSAFILCYFPWTHQIAFYKLLERKSVLQKCFYCSLHLLHNSSEERQNTTFPSQSESAFPLIGHHAEVHAVSFIRCSNFRCRAGALLGDPLCQAAKQVVGCLFCLPSM